MFQSAAEGILVADAGTRRFKYCNAAMSRLTGYGPEELTGMSAGDLSLKADRQRALDAFRALARGALETVSGLPMVRKDGTLAWVDIKATRAVVDGRDCVVGFFTDVTTRREVEQARARLQQAFTSP